MHKSCNKCTDNASNKLCENTYDNLPIKMVEETKSEKRIENENMEEASGHSQAISKSGTNH